MARCDILRGMGGMGGFASPPTGRYARPGGRDLWARRPCGRRRSVAAPGRRDRARPEVFTVEVSVAWGTRGVPYLDYTTHVFPAVASLPASPQPRCFVFHATLSWLPARSSPAPPRGGPRPGA